MTGNTAKTPAQMLAAKEIIAATPSISLVLRLTLVNDPGTFCANFVQLRSLKLHEFPQIAAGIR
jgi:hypothetical protein